MADNIEYTTPLESWRLFLVSKLDRHLDSDLAICGETQEIYVQRCVADRVELDFARQYAMGFAFEVDIDQADEET